MNSEFKDAKKRLEKTIEELDYELQRRLKLLKQGAEGSWLQTEVKELREKIGDKKALLMVMEEIEEIRKIVERESIPPYNVKPTLNYRIRNDAIDDLRMSLEEENACADWMNDMWEMRKEEG